MELAINRDDPGRVAPPDDWTLQEQVRYDTAYADAKEYHFDRVRTLVVACLAGRIPSCAVLCQGRMQTLDRAELYMLVAEDADLDDLAQSFVASEDWEAKARSSVWTMEWINAFVDKTAAHLAKKDMVTA